MRIPGNEVAGGRAGIVDRPARRLVALLLSLAVSCGVAQAGPQAAAPPAGRVAVLYPELSEPYRALFASIVSGIDAALDTPPLIIAVGGEGAADLRRRLDDEGIAVCIALGRSAVNAAQMANPDLPLVRGAVLDPSVRKDGEGPAAGISLAPDPAPLLQQLKRLAPRVNRVVVVYSAPDAVPLIARAVMAGQRLGIAVLPTKSADLLDAAATYRSVVPTLGPRDALWLPQDPQVVDDRVILPMLLNAAWEQNFVLFSSNADHAKRGALFSVYPDNLAMGRRLAGLAARLAGGAEPGQGMAPLEDLLIAVNLRTAEHLGLGLTAEQMRSFDLTFPQR